MVGQGPQVVWARKFIADSVQQSAVSGREVQGGAWSIIMEFTQKRVRSITPGPDMRDDPAVVRYVDAVEAMGTEWGRVVVLDPHGRVVLGRRRYDRAVRAGEVTVPTARLDVTDEEARLLRLADFAEADGLLLLTMERILMGGLNANP